MSMNDPISDYLILIRNGQKANKKNIASLSSKVKTAVSTIHQSEG